MIKKITLWILVAFLLVMFTACGGNSTTQTENEDVSQEEPTQVEENHDADFENLANVIAQDKDNFISQNASKFSEQSFTDPDTGLSLPFNLYLPENYDSAGSYPLVVFIADSSTAGKETTASLTQGLGGVIWASEQWQSAYPSIVAVPAYPETILDDHNGYSTTEYVEMTKRFIEYMESQYAVDTNRVYGTGQSMGCMTTMLLAAEYPDLYTACMLVDGQWDVNALKGLATQKFVYFAAEDDNSAWSGAQEVMAMFDTDAISYAYAQWDGNWTASELTDAANKLFSDGNERYFISWISGSIQSKTGNGPQSEMSNDQDGPKGPDGGPGNGPEGGGAGNGPMGGAGYHMASFDYAYSCISVMNWLFQQNK